ncbi:response regulator [Brevibacillus invocatus]|nr:response regulator transcription factor [Brevibacillus invocatus]MCM3429158.1 response regulator transcription factor [Brevibacillus invocatus]
MSCTSNRCKVLIVDDHPTVSFGTRFILEGVEKYEVVGVADRGVLAVEMFEQFSPHVILLDLMLPDMEGIEVARRMKEHNPDAHIVIFTGMNYLPILQKLIAIGISGVLTKEATPEQVIRMIEAVQGGETVIPLSLFRQIDFQKTKSKASTKDQPLTEKESYILTRVGRGFTNKQIAKELYMTTRSIEYYLTNIYQKLDVKSRAEAIEKYGKIGTAHTDT